MSLESVYQHLRAGRLAEAEGELRREIGNRPGAEALELLGIVLAQQGRAYEALELFDRALALRPDSAGARHNRAQALFSLGRVAEARAELDKVVAQKPDLREAWSLLGSVLAAQRDPKAEQAYRRALTLRPDHPETHYNLGVFFAESGRLEEAIACYRKALAIRPQFVVAHNNLANALRAQRRDEDALVHYAQAVQLDPGFADGWSNYGAALREMGRIDEAIPVLERAVALAPNAWAAASNLGVAYLARNRVQAAIDAQARALELKPDSAEAHANLGNALAAAARWDEAEAQYRNAIQRAPGYADAHNNLGMLRLERGDAAGAAASFRRALDLRPAFSEATNNLGLLLQEEGRVDEAIDLYRQALRTDPRNSRAAANLGITLVSRFHFAEGWEQWERRYDTIPPITIPRPFAVPRLERAAAPVRHLAIWREQGVGDQILYSTLIPGIGAHAQRFTVEVDARLVPAYRRAHPEWDVTSPDDSERAFAGCDAHIPMGSLPRLLRPSLESFAAQPQVLLAADPARAEGYRARLHEGKGAEPVIGIAWRSFQPKVRGEVGRRKSASLEAFRELSQRARLVDLQYGDTAAEREGFEQSGGRLARLAELDLFNDLDGLLAAIAACDAVVTTSNVTAHLAGAIGKRTLLVFLRARPPFHYWSSPGARSLWYPSVEIVTGPEVDSWPRAFERIHERLFG